MPSSRPAAGSSFLDCRIRGVFAMAPAIGQAFTQAGSADVWIPVKIVAGRADTVTPSANNAARLASLIAGSELTVLEGKVGHSTFGSSCTALGRQEYESCRDEAGVDRDVVHEQVAADAYRFFEEISSIGYRFKGARGCKSC